MEKPATVNARWAARLGLALAIAAVPLGITTGATAATSDWKIQPTPDPAPGSFFTAISCISASHCTAVGAYGPNDAATFNLAEVWNGSTWKLQSIGNPDGSYIVLEGVSCTSAAFCMAVGSYANRFGTTLTLAATWNGSKWMILHPPSPQGASFSNLSAVSCSSATACAAVGYSQGNSGAPPLAEIWNGTAWTIESTPPLPLSIGQLNAVSCVSATACTAVGTYENDSDDFVSLAESWNGSAWAIEPTPNPAGGGSIGLNAISCTSLTACTAAGDYFNASDNDQTLAESWNGSAWAIQPTPNPSGTLFIDRFLAVSCTSGTACIAVGYTSNGTLVEIWNGTNWVLDHTPLLTNGGSHGGFAGISCTSGLSCTAAGQYIDSSGNTETLAERRP
ncbi:MAG TPA: hypothetical protein VK784_01345 [Pseudonocardiaceae bacterium]|jgi:hypothetical protein|nr:hypothetical protein [Pseudonocardiaceae bacterium]